MLKLEASEAAQTLSSYRWQNTNKRERAKHARNMAQARWTEARKRELEAEHERQRALDLQPA